MSVACFAAAPEPPATSIPQARAGLSSRLADQIQLRIGLGDGRGAARALTVLAAIRAHPALMTQAAFALLDVYENTGLPRDIRARLISLDRDVHAKAAQELADAFKRLTAEHKVLANLRGGKILGAEEGCPVKHARAFASRPDGTVVMLSDGLVLYDGRRWQVAAPSAVRLHQPIETIFVDRKGRTWLGSTASGKLQAGLLGQLRAYNWGSVAYCRPAKGSLLPGRWKVLSGARRVTSFAEGKQGVWIASRSRLFLHRDGRALAVNCPLPYSPFRKLLAAPHSDELWVVDLDRVSHFDGVRWRSYRLGGLRPRGGTVYGAGALRAAVLTSGGLLDVADRKFRLAAAPKGVGKVVDIAAGKKGRIWCVTDKGTILSTDLRTFDVYAAPAVKAPPPWPPAIFCDKAGRIWVSRGRGIEVLVPPLAKLRTVSPGVTDARLTPVPLVSAAGSGGWSRDRTLFEAGADDEKKKEAEAEDLAGFPEDAPRRKGTPGALLEQLRKSPGSATTFTKLLGLLVKSPDAKIRKEALVLGANEKNRAFYARPEYARELAEVLLDETRPADAYMLLLEASHGDEKEAFRRAVEPALFEALVAMGFGEFARPAFLDADMAWPRTTSAGPPRFKTIRAPRSLAGMPGCKPALRAMTADIETEVGRGEFEDAALHEAMILADKRRVLASIGDSGLWGRLVSVCAKAGDVRAAKRYSALQEQVFGKAGDNALPPARRPKEARRAGLSPFRWIRRVKLGMDSGLGPVAGGGQGAVYVLDEGSNKLLVIHPGTGAVVGAKKIEDGAVRAVLLAPRGALVVVRLKGGGLAARSLAWLDALQPRSVRLAGLTDSFDGFSATAVKENVFYCFDGGLTRVDLKAGRVTWRNDKIVGGVNAWGSLLDRSLPVAAGGDVFVAAGRKLFCVGAASGRIRWAKDCGAGGTPAVAGGVVVLGAGRREVWGFDRKTGEPAWKHISAEQPGAVFVSDGKRVFYATQDGDVAALVAKTGEFLWRRPTDISVRYPASFGVRPTALLVRRGRLVACNKFGYIEFDVRDGAILRRLHVSTARPMAQAGQAVIVATAPNRLVAVADPAGGELAEKMLALADKAAQGGAPAKALAIARMVVTYVDPANRKAHELALKLCAEHRPASVRTLFTLLLSGADPFPPKARALMRGYVKYAPPRAGGAALEFGLVARAHMERGAVREAAETFAALGSVRSNFMLMGTLLELQLAAGQDEKAMTTARLLAAFGPKGAYVAVRRLALEQKEEEALDLASRFAGSKDSTDLLYLAVAVSGSSGLFEKAGDMLDRSSRLASRAVRANCLAYLLSNAGIADRALEKYGEDLRREIDRYRKMLEQRCRVLKALDRPDELKGLEAQIERLKGVEFP